MISEALPRSGQLPGRLHHWVAGGWLRGTDVAFAALLAEDGGERNETTLSLAALASYQVGEGHTRLDLEMALSEPERLWPEPPEGAGEADGPACWLGQVALTDAVQALTGSAVVDMPDPASPADIGTAPMVLDGHHLYLRRYWANEQLIREALDARLHAPKHTLPGLRSRLDTLFPPQDTEPDWQRVACALASRSRFTLITGGPGTGKTRTVLRLLGLLQSQRMDTDADRPLRIRLAAPTGKAAARLGESISGEIEALPLPEPIRTAIPREVSTLHRLLGPRPGSRLFRHDRHNPLHADLVVVDEASMIDQELTARLLDALRPETTLVLLGDKDQLASVEAGAVLGELCEGADAGHYTADTVAWVADASGDDISPWQAEGTALQQHIVKLRESRRFSAESGIGAFAESVRQGDYRQAAALLDGDDGDIRRMPLRGPTDARIDAAAAEGYHHYLDTLHGSRPAADDWAATSAWAREVLQAFAAFQVLAVVRHGRLGVSGLNERIARRLRTDGRIARESGWFEGRPVMVMRNDYELGLMNGDVGICLETRLPGEDEPRLRVAFERPDQGIRLFLPSRLEAVETVFAMTVHKSQGSEFRDVLVVLPRPDIRLAGRELLYTAVTRARRHSVIAHPGPS